MHIFAEKLDHRNCLEEKVSHQPPDIFFDEHEYLRLNQFAKCVEQSCQKEETIENMKRVHFTKKFQKPITLGNFFPIGKFIVLKQFYNELMYCSS
jgi:hypothetical protein